MAQSTIKTQTVFEAIERPTLLVADKLEYSIFRCARIGRIVVCNMTLKCKTDWATGGDGPLILNFPFHVDGWQYGNAGVSASQFSDVYTRIGRCVLTGYNGGFYCSLSANAGNFISANFVATLQA